MKLCRFELKSDPENARSGMVFAGKVYETDGANAVAVHEADAVRPLSPVPFAPSFRIFRTDLQPLPGPDSEDPHFFYGNPSCLVGTSQLINFPAFTNHVAVQSYVAAVIVTPGYRIPIDLADDMILGFTLLNMLVAPYTEADEKKLGGGYGRSYDVGAALGPVLTTPDELEDFLVDQQFGRRYGLSTVTRVNGVEKQRGNVEHLPWTFAEAISAASQSCTLREGDVFAMGPVVDNEEPLFVQPGDEVQLSIENLGALSLKLSEEQ